MILLIQNFPKCSFSYFKKINKTIEGHLLNSSFDLDEYTYKFKLKRSYSNPKSILNVMVTVPRIHVFQF